MRFVILLACSLACLLPSISQAAKEPSASAKEAAGWMERGYQASLEGDRPKTDTCFQRALALDPQGGGYRVSYGWALCNLGDYEAALKIWRIGFTGPDRNYWNRAVCQALAHYHLGHAEMAVEWYHLQRLGNVQWGSLDDMRHLTSYWRDPEKRAIEAIYKLWAKAESRSAKLLPKLKPRLDSEPPAASGSDPVLAGYEFKIQSRLDQIFLQELKSLKLVTSTEKKLSFRITISPERKVTVDPQEMDSAAFAEPLFAKAAFQALGTLAESLEAPPAAPDGTARSASFLAVFAVHLPSPTGS